jgi:UDP-glucose:(heptosyl)LPS alpha-1,3-glucosyltransferase
MKVALVSRHVNDFAGVPGHVSSLARALARNHEVTIFSETFEGLDGTGVAHQAVRWTGSAISLQDASPLQDAECDIVHSHHYDYPFPSDVMTSHYCEREGLDRIGLGVRDEDYSDSAIWSEGVAKAELELRLLELNKGSPLIVLSRRMKSEFIRHYGIPSEQIFVVRGGVDTDRYSPRNVVLFRKEVRQRYQVAPNQPLVLFVGGDWQRKGVAQAIAALSRVDSLGAKLMIVGPGDVRAYRRMATDVGIEGGVRFAGHRDDIWKYYAASDIFLLPTLYEAFGLVILEAMASGLPVLVSRWAGAAELIHDGIDGLLINDPTDVAEISAKLGVLLRDEGLRRRIGDNARRAALHYSWAGVARMTLEVYDRVLQLRQRRLKGASALPA